VQPSAPSWVTEGLTALGETHPRKKQTTRSVWTHRVPLRRVVRLTVRKVTPYVFRNDTIG
jgi:hypothetical protein